MSKNISKKIASNEFLPDISGMSEEEKSKVFINFCRENIVEFTKKVDCLIICQSSFLHRKIWLN